MQAGDLGDPDTVAFATSQRPDDDIATISSCGPVGLETGSSLPPASTTFRYHPAPWPD
jgi:hypothetical protein